MIDKLDLPLLADVDIVVVGGGPSGLGASIAAARMGGNVLLVEQTSMLGGMGTAGLVPMFAPVFDGARVLYGGIFQEVILEMCHQMNVTPWLEQWQSIEPETLKRIYDTKTIEAGVKLLFQAKLCEAEVQDGRINAILVATCQGLKRIEGKLFIDATGDALLAKLAGAPFLLGDDDGKTMGPTFCAEFAGIDYSIIEQEEADGISARTVWQRLSDEGKTPFEEAHFVSMKRHGRRMTAGSNIGHLYGLNTLDEWELSQGYVNGRKMVAQIEEFFKQYVHGFEKACLVNTATLLGVRETRRIDGEFLMTAKDFEERAEFPDGIGRCCYPVDIHASTNIRSEQEQAEKTFAHSAYKAGESYAIPFRALIPKGIKNLLVPGRALSADRVIQSSLRIMPACFVTGQAAGTAAVLYNGDDVRATDIAGLRARLAEAGAKLAPTELH